MAGKTSEEKAAEEKAAEVEAAEVEAAEKKAKDQALIDSACKAYGVDPKYLFASRIDGDEAVILTNGGKRVRYRKGDKVEPLDSVAVTGVNPAAKKRKVIAGKKK